MWSPLSGSPSNHSGSLGSHPGALFLWKQSSNRRENPPWWPWVYASNKWLQTAQESRSVKTENAVPHELCLEILYVLMPIVTLRQHRFGSHVKRT